MISLKLVLVLLALGSACASAQQSLFESGNGDTSVFLSGNTGVVSYNLGNSTARFGYVHDAGASNYFHHLAFGVGAGGTVDSQAATLVNQNAPAPGGFVEMAAVWKPAWARSAGADVQQSDEILNPAPCKAGTCPPPPGPVAVAKHKYYPDKGLSTDWWVVQFHYGRTQFYLLPSPANPVGTPIQTSFDRYRGTIAYNQLRHSDYGDWTLGVAASPGTANNLSDLTQESYQNQFLTTTSSGQMLLNSTSHTVYIGGYSRFVSIPVNADVILQPRLFKYLLGFDAMLRSELGGGSSERYAGPGIGAYFFKAGSPVVPLGGLTFSYRNGQSEVAVVVGWSFGR